MLSELLDIVNADSNEPDWDHVYATAKWSDAPTYELLLLARALWLENNDIERYDALVAGMGG